MAKRKAKKKRTRVSRVKRRFTFNYSIWFLDEPVAVFRYYKMAEQYVKLLEARRDKVMSEFKGVDYLSIWRGNNQVYKVTPPIEF